MKNKLCLNKFITPECRTLIWAPSDAGKSYFVQYLSFSMACGVDMFFFEISKPRKVVIFDFEIGKDQWEHRIAPMQKQYPIFKGSKENLYRIRVKNNPDYEALDLFSKKWQEDLLSLWKGAGIEVVFLDNIISSGSSIASYESKLNKLFEFISQIELNGIAVVLVHHSNKGEQEMKGSYDLIAKCHNIIKLEGRKQILTESQLHEIKGAVIRIIFDKCKEAAEWENESYIFHLPMDSGKWIALDKDNGLPSPDSGENSEDDTDALQSTGCTVPMLAENNNDSVEKLQVVAGVAPILKGLSVQAKKVYDYTKDKPKWTRNDIDVYMGWDKKTSAKYIKELITSKLIDKLGSGPSTYYRLR